VNLTVSTPEQRKLQALIDRNRAVERIGLLGAVSLLVLALVLVYSAKRPNLAADRQAIDAKRLVNLNTISGPSDVLPALESIDGETDRQVLAKSIYDLVIRNERELPRVGLLSAIRGLGVTDIREIKKRVIVRTPQEFWRSQWFNAVLLAVPFWIVHLIWWKRRFRGDGLILPSIHILCALGYVMMISIRDPLRDSLSSAPFAQGVAGGCALLLVFSLFDVQRSQIRRLAFVPLLVSFVLSILLFVFGSGPGTSDAKVNLFGFQPVEIIKLLLVLFLAGYFAEHWELIRELREKPPQALGGFSRWMKLPPMQYVKPIAIGVGVALLFFTLQRDFGPGLIVSVLFLVYYGVARRKIAVVALGLAMIIGAFWFLTAFGVSRTVATRVAMWQSPWRNFATAGGDHLAHSLWAFASGGVAGAGFGLGNPESVREVGTDFILAGIGEELGFVGTLCVLALYALILFRSLKIMQRRPGDYAFFLCLGMTTITGLQILLIGGGVLGVFPLSGVTTPFLSYGRSSLLASFCVFGVILSISNYDSETHAETKRFAASVKVLGISMGAGLALLAVVAFNVQVLRADSLVAEPVLAYQADKQHRLTYNPRLLEAAAKIPRGTIFDRNGIPLATNHWQEIETRRKQYQEMGVKVDTTVSKEDSRHYPFGGVLFHLLGDARTEANWRASNTSYIERDSEPHLRGFNDDARLETLTTPDGGEIEVERHDYSGLAPLLRYAHRPNHPAVKRILEKNRDLHTTIDGRLQVAVAQALRAEVLDSGKSKGAAVVIDPSNGDVLASVSYPWPGDVLNAKLPPVKEFNRENQLDRARYGLYPPGSTFKLITAMAALEKSPSYADQKFFCSRLSDGRVGAVIPGLDRPIRDDVNDTHPHGEVNLAQGLIVSCNAYYAQLGLRVGSDALHKMASSLSISAASPNTPNELRQLLPQASYGQGEVLATPFQMTRAVSAIVNDGNMLIGRWVTGAQNSRNNPPRRVISAGNARFLARTMRLAVTSGTGTRAQLPSVLIAGKTGTAEIANGVSHSWFVGFAPYNPASRKIAFGVIIENGGYGGRSAAALARRIVERSKALGIIE
jgi:cell division protein FtsI/penicillin-binding protein 2